MEGGEEGRGSVVGEGLEARKGCGTGRGSGLRALRAISALWLGLEAARRGLSRERGKPHV